MSYICPKITKHQLLTQCSDLGIAAGDLLMVHASMKAVGEILGGPDLFIEALKESVGSRGTLMSYLGCELPNDDVGRGIFSREEDQFIVQHLPVFDPNTARANREHGLFAEFFRTHGDVVCSRNPGSRMGTWGADAQWLTEDHPYNYGLGKDSPLDKFCQKQGKVLLAGSDLDNVTLLHYAEAIAPIPNKRLVNIKLHVLIDGQGQWIDVVEFDSSYGVKMWDDDFFAEIIKAFVPGEYARQGKLGNADCYLLDAQKLVEFAITTMVQTAEKLDAVPMPG